MPRIRERARGVYEITASTGRRDPATGKYGQVSLGPDQPLRFQVGLGTDRFDLGGEVGEEVGDLVEAVAVLA